MRRRHDIAAVVGLKQTFTGETLADPDRFCWRRLNSRPP